MRERFVGEVVSRGAGFAARDHLGDGDVVPIEGNGVAEGDIVAIDGGHVVECLARGGTARSRLYGLLAAQELDPLYPTDVLTEVERWRDDPGIEGNNLVDLTALPFVTIDGPGTRDLDQALHVEPVGNGHRVRYALADAAWFVHPGTALFTEALRRGASFYLPGLAVPMLPRALSEGLVSLNPRVERRAMVFAMDVDDAGNCTNTQIVRARIRSRAQLTFDAVQTLLDGGEGHGIADRDVVDSLCALKAVGEQKLREAAQRDAIPHRHAELRVQLGKRGLSFVAYEEMRNATERYSEQLSLMCNTEGARFLRDRTDSGELQPIFRTHAAPDTERLEAFAAKTRAVAEARGLDPRFRWEPQRQGLGDFIRGLPTGGAEAGVARALARQAIMVNVRSMFTSEPGPHFGIGADAYARFSAPMREIVGVFVHKETWETLAGASGHSERDEALRDQIIDQANRARAVQRELTRQANLLVLDELLGADLAQTNRPVRRGTVLGMQAGKLYVRLDDPPVDVKVYASRMEPDNAIDDLGVRLQHRGKDVCVLGDAVGVRVRERASDGRWLLDLVREAG